MEAKEAINDFFDGIFRDIEANKRDYAGYLLKSIEDFMNNNTVENADLVYLYYMSLYRTADVKGGPLTDMIDVMHTYEMRASTLTDHHRDHYIHSVNVFLLGMYIYVSSPKIKGAFDKFYGKGTFDTPALCFLFIWGNTALFHDVGYPIEIASNQAKRFVKMISNIDGKMNKPAVGIEIDPVSSILSLAPLNGQDN